MIIQCPSCRYSREVPDSSLRPGRSYKITCPKCSTEFPFSMPAEASPADVPPADALPAEADARMPSEPAEGTPASPDPAPSEAPQAKEQEKPVPDPAPAAPAAEQDDDPLPEGAVIPELPAPEENHAFREKDPAESQEKKDGGLLGKWLQIRDNLRRYDESQERDEDEPSDGLPDGAPWENPQYYGTFGSFSRTMLGVLFRPRSFFRHLRCSNPVIYPIFFYILLSLFQMLCNRLWTMDALRSITRTATDTQSLALAETIMTAMNLPLMVLFTPFFSIFQVVLLAGLYHLMIRMVSPDRADFTLTLRVICYSAAPCILCIIPYFGSQLATVWFAVSSFIGCMYALGVSPIRMLGALLPLYIILLVFLIQVAHIMAL
ncbi:MAG: zinc-ribbon domain-containing protein [Mailhella sp.]|nr:zinc-ribbon domain-containing protein [Mailhella sp.]